MSTIVTLEVRERATDRAYAVTLGEFRAVWAPGITIGSSDECAVVLRGEGVAEVHLEARAASNHRFVTAFAPGVRFMGRDVAHEDLTAPVVELRQFGRRVDDHPFELGPFTLRFGQTSASGEPSERGVVPGDGPVRLGSPQLPPQHPRHPVGRRRVERYGPHTATVVARFTAFESARWLHPDATMVSLSADAGLWVEARLSEHLAALAPYASAGTALAIRHVTFTRSFSEAIATWRARWSAEARDGGAPGRGYLEAFAHATRGVAGGVEVDYDARERVGEAREVVFSDPAVFGSIDRALTRVVPPDSDREEPIVPAADLVWHEIEHAMRVGDDPATPSPWTPLLALWERGVWPIALPDGDAIVYVPVREDDALVADPADPPATAHDSGDPARLDELAAALPECEPVMPYWARRRG